MKLHIRPLLVLAVCLLLAGAMVFAVACGTSTTTTTTTAAPATTTTAAATVTTVASSAAASGTMAVKGLVDKPGNLTVADLKAMKVTTITAEHPKKGSMQFTGVLFKDIMTAVGVQSTAKVADMGATDGYMGEVTLAELDPNAMIAIGDDGKLNAVMPGMEGKAWVTDITSIEFK